MICKNIKIWIWCTFSKNWQFSFELHSDIFVLFCVLWGNFLDSSFAYWVGTQILCAAEMQRRKWEFEFYSCVCNFPRSVKDPELYSGTKQQGILALNTANCWGPYINYVTRKHHWVWTGNITPQSCSHAVPHDKILKIIWYPLREKEHNKSKTLIDVV